MAKTSHSTSIPLERKSVSRRPLGGGDHILSKNGKKQASADVGFIFIAYNLKRILSVMGEKGSGKCPHSWYFVYPA